MLGKLFSALDTACLKLLHPSVKTHGFHAVRPGTEIKLRRGGQLSIGRGVRAEKRVTFSVIGGRMTVGDRSSFNRNAVIVCRDAVTIGKGCCFGPNLVIYDHDHRFSPEGAVSDGFKSSPIVIEDQCWIGAGVTILRGTHIGAGCVIGAGAVVKGDIPAHSLVKSERKLVIEPIREG